MPDFSYFTLFICRLSNSDVWIKIYVFGLFYWPLLSCVLVDKSSVTSSFQERESSSKENLVRDSVIYSKRCWLVLPLPVQEIPPGRFPPACTAFLGPLVLCCQVREFVVGWQLVLGWCHFPFPYGCLCFPQHLGSVCRTQSNVVPDSLGEGLWFPKQDSWDNAGAILAEEQNI